MDPLERKNKNKVISLAKETKDTPSGKKLRHDFMEVILSYEFKMPNWGSLTIKYS